MEENNYQLSYAKIPREMLLDMIDIAYYHTSMIMDILIAIDDFCFEPEYDESKYLMDFKTVKVEDIKEYGDDERVLGVFLDSVNSSNEIAKAYNKNFLDFTNKWFPYFENAKKVYQMKMEQGKHGYKGAEHGKKGGAPKGNKNAEKKKEEIFDAPFYKIEDGKYISGTLKESQFTFYFGDVGTMVGVSLHLDEFHLLPYDGGSVYFNEGHKVTFPLKNVRENILPFVVFRKCNKNGEYYAYLRSDKGLKLEINWDNKFEPSGLTVKLNGDTIKNGSLRYDEELRNNIRASGRQSE